MASTQIDFSKITPDNGAIRELSELIFLKFMQEPNALDKFCVWNTGVFNGDKVVGLGRFGPLGRNITSQCGNDYETNIASTQEKVWAIGAWGIFEQICVDDVIPTLVKTALKSGTSISDLTGTDYLDNILMPLLGDAVERLLWRLAWFGDTQAANVVVTGGVVSGGVITAGLNTNLFTPCDGLFKRLTAITIDNPEQRVAIVANSQTTKKLQKSKLREDGVAIGLMDDTIGAMSMVLRQQPNKAIIVTQSVADALAIDMKRNRGSELQWDAVINGITATKYDGHDVFAVPLWDEMIGDFFQVKGDALDYAVNPHRIVATTLDNLLLGTSSSETLAALEAWYDQKTELNHIKAKDTIGTQIWQDNLVVYGY